MYGSRSTCEEYCPGEVALATSAEPSRWGAYGVEGVLVADEVAFELLTEAEVGLVIEWEFEAAADGPVADDAVASGEGGFVQAGIEGKG